MIGKRKLTANEIEKYHPTMLYSAEKPVQKVDEIEKILRSTPFTLLYVRRPDCIPCIDFEPFIFNHGKNLQDFLGKAIPSRFIYVENDTEDKEKHKEMYDFIELYAKHVPAVVVFARTEALINVSGDSLETRRAIESLFFHIKAIINAMAPPPSR